MQTSYEALHRALELAADGKIDAAQAALAEEDDPLAVQLRAYFTQERLRDEERASLMSRFRHDLGNALAIAQASLEGMLDGIVLITEPRLNRLREILIEVGDSLQAITMETPRTLRAVSKPDDGRAAFTAEINELIALAEAKTVQLEYEPAHDAWGVPIVPSNPEGAAKLRNALLKIVRLTPSGSALHIVCTSRGSFTVSAPQNAANLILEAFGSAALFLEETPHQATLLVSL